MTVRTESLDFPESRLLLTRLRLAAHGDGADPKSFALLLGKAASARAWEEEGFATFTAYVRAAAPRGLGMTADQITHAAALAGSDTSALVKRLLADEVPTEAYPGRPEGTFDTKNLRDTKVKCPESDVSERVIARLKRDRPDLAEQVVNGELTPNAAAMQMGWRKRRLVLSDRLESVAATLRDRYDPDQLRLLVKLLTEEELCDPTCRRPFRR